MAGDSEQDTSNFQDRHRRETLRQIILPLGGGMVLVLLALGVIVSPLFARRMQVAAVSDLLLTVFVLCPLLLCLFPLYLLLALLAVNMNRVYRQATRGLQRVDTLSQNVAAQTSALPAKVSQVSDALAEKLEPVDRVLGVFDAPESPQLGREAGEQLEA